MRNFLPRARRVLRRERRRLLTLPGVVGAGVGWRECDGVQTGEPAVVVFVTRKLPLAALAAAERVPDRLGGLRTDVVAIGYPRALVARPVAAVNPRRRLRPALPGCSIGHFRGPTGTLGALVADRRDGRVLMLSNNHVLANASSNRDGRARRGDAVLQPGPADGGTADDGIGRLQRFVPLQFEGLLLGTARAASLPGGTAASRSHRLPPPLGLLPAALVERANRVDAAVAEPFRPADLAPDILGLGRPRGSRAASPGDAVVKSGRTTGVTRGVVRAVAVAVRVDMGGGRAALFVEQLVTTPMAAPGDSGSLLLDEAGFAVGLVGAGSDQATIAAPIDAVLDALDLELVV